MSGFGRVGAKLAIAGVLVVASSAMAYELDTHARVTSRAFDLSQVEIDASVAERLGWRRYRSATEFDLPVALEPALPRRRYLDVLPDRWTQAGLSGLTQRPTTLFDREQFPEGAQDAQDEARIRAWLMRGAVREDDVRLEDFAPGELRPDADPNGELVRVYHHFYAPILDRQLTPDELPVCSALPGRPPSNECVRATDWAMGTTNGTAANDPVAAAALDRRNHFSWADAREAMWCGLTYRRSGVTPQRDAAIRRYCWATSVKSLGHVLHLAQDLGQPQHTRNDRHNPEPPAPWQLLETTIARRTFETCTNWRATGGEISSPADESETFRQMFSAVDDVPSPPALDGYPIPRFATPIDYFTTRRSGEPAAGRRGIADFSNRNFYSEGTLFAGYALPPPDPNDPSLLYVDTGPVTIPGRGIRREIDVLSNRIESAAPGFVDTALVPFGGRIPVSRTSLWTEFGASSAPERKVGIPLEHYRVHADVLLPRAVAYSAGLINLFFRGQLEVSEPTAGLVAAIDQGVPHQIVDGYPRRTDNNQVLGFTKLRLGVRNVTASITVSGTGQVVVQQADQGQLVAVARYHRNPCYIATLYGEWTQVVGQGSPSVPSGTCTRDQLRTGYEEASVSAPLQITSPLASASTQQYEFDFGNDPIPVNATDLFVQVVYRGRLGQERDGIAVGRRDLPEPFHYVVLNMTDYYANQGQWFPTAPGFDDARSPDVATSFDGSWFDTPTSPSGTLYFASQGALPSARFVRVAAIGREAIGRSLSRLTFQRTGLLQRPSASNYSLNRPRQATTEEVAPGVYAPTTTLQVRGVQFHRLDFYYQFFEPFVTPSDIAILPPRSPQTAQPGAVGIVPPLRFGLDSLVPGRDEYNGTGEVVVYDTEPGR